MPLPYSQIRGTRTNSQRAIWIAKWAALAGARRIARIVCCSGTRNFMQSRLLTIRLIRLAMAASLVLPFLLFAFASLTSYHNIHALADERLLRSLDVQQEEATKTFELIDLTVINALDLVAGMSETDIRQNEERLHLQFKKYSDAVTIVQSIWIYDTDGHAIVT